MNSNNTTIFIKRIWIVSNWNVLENYTEIYVKQDTLEECKSAIIYSSGRKKPAPITKETHHKHTRNKSPKQLPISAEYQPLPKLIDRQQSIKPTNNPCNWRCQWPKEAGNTQNYTKQNEEKKIILANNERGIQQKKRANHVTTIWPRWFQNSTFCLPLNGTNLTPSNDLVWTEDPLNRSWRYKHTPYVNVYL